MSVRILSGKRMLIATCVVTIFATTTFGAAFNDLFGRDWRRLNGKDMQLLQKTMRRSPRRAIAGRVRQLGRSRYGRSRPRIRPAHLRAGRHAVRGGRAHLHRRQPLPLRAAVLPQGRRVEDGVLGYARSDVRTSAKRRRVRSATAILGTMGFAATTQSCFAAANSRTCSNGSRRSSRRSKRSSVRSRRSSVRSKPSAPRSTR